MGEPKRLDPGLIVSDSKALPLPGLLGKEEPFDHPSDRRCKLCGAPLPRPHFHYYDPPWLGRMNWVPITICASCESSYGKRGIKEAIVKWKERTPVEFARDWEPLVGNDALLKRVLEYDHLKRKGMLLFGSTGRCKTRVAYQLAKKLTIEGIDWHFITGLQVVTGKIPDVAYTAEVLFLDDIGNEPFGKSADAVLLGLIRTRCDNHKPMIITTQHTPETLVQRFPGLTMEAVVRRILEFCDPINASDSDGSA